FQDHGFLPGGIGEKTPLGVALLPQEGNTPCAFLPGEAVQHAVPRCYSRSVETSQGFHGLNDAYIENEHTVEARGPIMTSKELSEAAKIQRVPGIIFADGAAGRRARIAGTGLEVFEVIKAYRDDGGGEKAVIEVFHWLTPAQIRAAIDYYQAFPAEIDERLAAEDALVPQRLRS
ncbi:MAG: DUF433 domain-containing protein, partial [Dehalococcoidia bacterium]